MAKHRKTRHQKIVADHRHITYHLENSAQVSLPVRKKDQFDYSLDLSTTSKTNSLSYTHVLVDIKKTAIVTSLIILAQLILFLYMRGI